MTPSKNTAPCEALMPFTIRPHRRFPVQFPVTYHAGLDKGQGVVWNLSLNGCRLSGNLPLRVGQSFPMTVTLPNKENLFVAGAIVRWRHGLDYGVETLVMEKQTQSRLAQYVKRLVQMETHAETLRQMFLTV